MKRILLLSFLVLPLFLHAQEQPVVKQLPMKTYTIERQNGADTFYSLPLATTRASAAATDGYRWIDRIKNMPDYWVEFYEKYSDAAKEALSGKVNWLTNPELGEKVGSQYGILVTTFKETLTNATVEDVVTASTKEWEDVLCFFDYFGECINKDIPEVFWKGNRTLIANSINYKQLSNGNIEYDLNVYFILKDEERDFDFRHEDYLVEGKLAKDFETYKECCEEILSGIPEGADRYETIKYLNEWLTTHNYYNPNMASNTCSWYAWTPLSALAGLEDKDAPVCEGYARAFKVLCDKLDIPCVLCVGLAKNRPNSPGESHMWNEVLMNDDKWYAVDVTWNDPTVSGATPKKISGYETESWLLLGSQDENPSGFTFAESHPFSLSKMVHEEYLKQWDLDFRSLITENKYDPAGIDAVISESGAPAEIYTLGGIPVSEVTQGFYILRKDGTSSKIFVK